MRLFRLLTVLLLAIGGASVAVTPASAHDSLASSSPAEGTTVEAGVISIELSFAEPVMQTPDGAGSVISVLAPDGTELTDGCLDVFNGTTISDSIDADQEGSYTVNWRTVSNDGHPVEGSYAFNVQNKTNYVATGATQCQKPVAIEDKMSTTDVATPKAAKAPGAAIDPWVGLASGIFIVVVMSVLGALRIRTQERKVEKAKQAKRDEEASR